MEQKMKNAIQLIINNIQQGGLYRYDPADVETYYFYGLNHNKRRLPRKVYRTFDIFLPKTTRKVLKLKKTINPGVYYHLGMAMLENEKGQLQFSAENTSESYAKMAIQRFYDDALGIWVYEDCVTRNANVVSVDRIPSLPMHFVARYGILLLRLWKYTGNNRYLEIAIKTSQAILKQHNIIQLPDGAAAISYFYNTMDITLNINAEFLQFVADIPADRRTPEVSELAHAILRLLLHAQNGDGSFEYTITPDKMHFEHAINVDHHHTASTLANLVYTLNSDFPTEEERAALLTCCVKGMQFYLDHLFHKDSGIAITNIHVPKRTPGTVPYGEGLVALCAYLRTEAIPMELRMRIQKKIPEMVNYLLGLVNQTDGSMPCDCICKRWIRLDSIRWGNGVALQAFTTVLAAEHEGLLTL